METSYCIIIVYIFSFLIKEKITKIYRKREKIQVKECTKPVFSDTITLRRLERVFRCCSVCETKEDYKEGCLMVWANYMSPCSSIVGLYFKGTCDVISVTMATHKVHKSVL